LHAQRKLLVGHVEQARVLDGDGGLPGKSREHVGVFGAENRAAAFVAHLQHTDGPPAGQQGHR